MWVNVYLRVRRRPTWKREAPSPFGRGFVELFRAPWSDLLGVCIGVRTPRDSPELVQPAARACKQ